MTWWNRKKAELTTECNLCTCFANLSVKSTQHIRSWLLTVCIVKCYCSFSVGMPEVSMWSKRQSAKAKHFQTKPVILLLLLQFTNFKLTWVYLQQVQVHTYSRQPPVYVTAVLQSGAGFKCGRLEQKVIIWGLSFWIS